MREQREIAGEHFFLPHQVTKPLLLHTAPNKRGRDAIAQRLSAMAPSLSTHPSFTRPRTSDRDGRPSTRDQGPDLLIPSRTSSLHSRITQPAPATLSQKAQQRTPKTLTHAYMVCGVGREPSQWVKAPAPAQGKIGHMKGAVGQFWLPEILGSSPRLEQDNEIARALHAAMKVCFDSFGTLKGSFHTNQFLRHASPTMLRSALAEASLTASTTPLFSSKIHLTLFTAFPFVSGLGLMKRELRLSATCERGPKRISTITSTRPTGFPTVFRSFLGILCTIF